jgi:hypothetical protein
VLVIVALQYVTVRALGCQEKSDWLRRRKSSVEVDGGELLRIVAGKFNAISRGESFFILVGGYGVAESKHILTLPHKEERTRK